MSYGTQIEELEKKRKPYEEYMASSAYLKNAEADARVAQEAAINNANTAYAQQKATYGTRAENMSAMGLTGGGYSDYLQAQAYAQQRADTTAANAQYASTMRNARYIDYENWKAEQDKLDTEINAAKDAYRTNYASLLGDVKSGKLTAEEANALAAKYGISEADIGALNTAATTYATEKQDANYAQLLAEISANGYTPEQTKALAKALGITDPTYLANLDKAASDYEIEQIKASGISTEDVAKNDGLYDSYNKQEAAKITSDMFSGASYASIATDIAEALNDPYLSETNKDTIKEHFKNTYGAEYGTIKAVENASVSSFEKRADKNCTVTIGNEEYDVQNKGVVTDTTAEHLNASFANANGTVTNNMLVTHGGNIYYYTGGKWYQLEARGNGTASQVAAWNALVTAVGAKDFATYNQSAVRKAVTGAYNTAADYVDKAATGVQNAYDTAAGYVGNAYDAASSYVGSAYDTLMKKLRLK